MTAGESRDSSLPSPGLRGAFAELLTAVGDAGAGQLLANVDRRDYSPGASVLEQREFVDRLYVVEDGILRAEVPDRHGLPLEVARYGPGDYFGEMSFLRGDRASATVRALTRSHVLGIPHRVLGEVAERSPGLIRELAGVVAARLSATNLRFRELRPGRLVAGVGTGSSWGRDAMMQILMAASRHARRPVVLVDTSGIGEWERVESLPSIDVLVRDAAVLAAHDIFAARASPAVGLVRLGGAGLPLEPTLHALSELQSRYPLVVVWTELDRADQAALLDSSDGPLLLIDEGDDPGRWSELGGRPGAQAFLLRRNRDPLVPAQVSALPTIGGARVVQVIPGGPEAVRSAPAPGTLGDSPWREINWCARHLIRKKVGLALGAGGSKGYAHLGVIEGLRALGVPFDYIAGSSIGAPIAAALAGGVDLGQLKGNLDRTFGVAMRLTLPIRSFLSSRPIRRELEAIAGGHFLEELPIPLAIVAADLYERTEVVFREGPIAPAMIASMAIPGIFPPLQLGGRTLVDGGLLNPIPSATVADMGADVVIGVKLTNPVGRQRTPPRRRFALRAPPIVDSITHAFEIMQWKITSEGAARSDVTIEPTFTGLTGIREYTRGGEFIEAGRYAVEASRGAIVELLPWAGSTD